MIPIPSALKPSVSRCRWLLAGSFAVALAVGSMAMPASAQQQPPQLCKPGHNYDQAKGLCYDPGTAYKANIPKDESSSGGFLSGLNSTLGLGGTLSLCNYGDQHVGSGEQAYCVNRRTGQAYPASR